LRWVLWPLWGDEIASTAVAKATLRNFFIYYTFDPHPPLFYTTLRLPSSLGVPDQLLKLIPLAYSLLTVWLVYRILLRLKSARAAVVGSLMMALCPLAIFLGGELRGVGATAFWATLGLYLLIKWLDEGAAKPPRAAWASVAVASLHHYYGIFFFAALMVIPFALGLARERKILYFKGAIWAALLWAAWSPLFVSQYLHGQSFREMLSLKRLVFFSATALTISGCPWEIQNLFGIVPLNYKGFLLLSIISLPFFATFAVGFWRRDFWRDAARIWFIAPFLAAFATANVIPIFTIKYNGVFLPPLFIGIALGLDHLSRIKKLLATAASLALTFTLLGFALDLNVNPKHQPPNWPKVVKLMERQAEPSDVIVSYGEWAASDFFYHLRKSPLGQIRSVEVLGPNQPGRIPKVTSEHLSKLAENLKGVKRVWFITHHISFADPQAQAEKFLASLYPHRKKWVINKEMRITLHLYWRR